MGGDGRLPQRCPQLLHFHHQPMHPPQGLTAALRLLPAPLSTWTWLTCRGAAQATWTRTSSCGCAHSATSSVGRASARRRACAPCWMPCWLASSGGTLTCRWVDPGVLGPQCTGLRCCVRRRTARGTGGVLQLRSVTKRGGCFPDLWGRDLEAEAVLTPHAEQTARPPCVCTVGFGDVGTQAPWQSQRRPQPKGSVAL